MKRRSSVGVQWVGLVGIVTACAVACSDPPRTDAGMDAATNDEGSGSDAIADDAPGSDGGIEAATDASTLPDCGPPGMGPTFTSVTAAMGVGLESAQLALAPDGTPRMVFTRDGTLRFTAGAPMGETWSWVTMSLPRPTGATKFGYGASLHVDAEGTAHVASVITEGAFSSRIAYHRKADATPAWSVEEISHETALTSVVEALAIAQASDGTVGLVFAGRTPFTGIQFLQRSGTGAWNRRGVLEDRNYDTVTSLAVDPSMNFVTAFGLSEGALMARLEPSAIVTEPIDLAAGIGQAGNLVLGLSSSGAAAVLAVVEARGYFVSTRRDGAWHPTLVEADATARSNAVAGRDIAVAVDAMERAHVIYIHQGDNAVRYARQNGCAWDLTTLDTGAASYGWVSLALDASGAPHMAFLRTATAGGTVELRYAH